MMQMERMWAAFLGDGNQMKEILTIEFKKKRKGHSVQMTFYYYIFLNSD